MGSSSPSRKDRHRSGKHPREVMPAHLTDEVRGDASDDAEERDAFADRLRQRELSRKEETRRSRNDRKAHRPDSQAHADAPARESVTANDLRERSRQEYLRKREQSRLELLRGQIEDEEQLFQGMKLTDAERERLEYQREVLRLAEERKDIKVGVEGYVMPEDYITEKGKIDRKRKEQVLYQRYQEPDRRGPGATSGASRSEQEQWEERQISRTLIKGKVREPTAATATDEPGTEPTEFDYILDETAIDFVMESTLDPETDADREARE
ncbi:hypothetical protein IWQ60_007532, partial [Tieghemiomyces parasiticus]